MIPNRWQGKGSFISCIERKGGGIALLTDLGKKHKIFKRVCRQNQGMGNMHGYVAELHNNRVL